MRQNIILRAPVFTVSGYGSHARDLAIALFDSMLFNVSLAPTDWASSSRTDDFPPDVLEKLIFMAENKLKTDDFTFIHVGPAHEFQKIGKVSIGITAGLESNKLPKSWIDKCNEIDATIVPSTFEHKLFLNSGVTKPVYVSEEGVDLSVYGNNVDCKLALQFDTKFNFLTSGQWLSGGPGEDRKQIGRLIQTIRDTFPDSKDVGLVIKTHMLNNSSPDMHFVKERIRDIKGDKDYPRIFLVHGVMSDREIAQLYKHPNIHAFVSLTSGEGWFRPLAEAVASDLPILVTGWSGHMDYVNPDLSTVFDFEMGQIPRSACFSNLLDPSMQWAVTDDKDVRRKLKRCVENYPVAKERAVKLGEVFRSKFSVAETNKKFVGIIDSIIESISPSAKSANLTTPTAPHVKVEEV